MCPFVYLLGMSVHLCKAKSVCFCVFEYVYVRVRVQSMPICL